MVAQYGGWVAGVNPAIVHGPLRGHSPAGRPSLSRDRKSVVVEIFLWCARPAPHSSSAGADVDSAAAVGARLGHPGDRTGLPHIYVFVSGLSAPSSKCRVHHG